jgi:hypothetical protein
LDELELSFNSMGLSLGIWSHMIGCFAYNINKLIKIPFFFHFPLVVHAWGWYVVLDFE